MLKIFCLLKKNRVTANIAFAGLILKYQMYRFRFQERFYRYIVYNSYISSVED